MCIIITLKKSQALLIHIFLHKKIASFIDAMSEKSPYHDFYLYNIGCFRKLESLYCASYKSGIAGTDQEVHLVRNLAFLTSLSILDQKIWR